ncbi:MAG TPA: protein kinase [Planctomycetota bacterium]|nr:protein kinase [Planctomycetota bacterium]
MALVVKIACPGCGLPHDSVSLGAEIRCSRCGRDFKAQGDGDGASRVLSVTPEEMDSVPYSQRTIEVPVNKVSSVILADPTLLNDKLLRDAPLKENAKWVGKVRLLKKLGQGGMGAVYHGYDESLALDVAVKILPSPSGVRDDQFVERFRQEARISAQINHPNVVRTLHVDEQGELIYLVMDFIAGRTARDLVDANGPLMFPRALQIIHDATLGMQAAHTHNVIHRDIKPDNILVADDGRVLLSDLGLAKAVSSSGHGTRMPVTRLGLLLGTPEYMSPEQWEIGAVVGPAADIWSMGATLWMLLTHKPPYDEKDMALLARKIKEAPLPDIREERANVPDCILDILHRCLAKRPSHRYVSAAELLAAINAALDAITSGRSTVTPGLYTATAPVPAQPIYQPAPVAPPVTAMAAAPGMAATPAVPPPVFSAGAVPQPASTASANSRSRLWIAVPVLAAAAAGAWTLGQGRTKAPVVAAANVSLDLHCPTQVKPGQDADLRAEITGGNPDDYTVLWNSQNRVFTGSRVRVPLEHDTEFTVVLRDKNSARDVTRRNVRVAVELQAQAAEKNFYEISAGTPLKFEARVRGGAGVQQIETRWIAAANPEKPVSSERVFDLTPLKELETPGRYEFVFQARRSDQNWNDAISDRVTVNVTRRIPHEYKAAMQLGTQARERAFKALSGVDAVANLRVAQAAFEQAVDILDEEDARQQIAACKQRLEQEEKYAALLIETRRLREAAEALPAADGVKKLSAWSEALRPIAAALALFDRPELREQAAFVEARLKELKSNLVNAEQDRVLFETTIAKARASVKEARKYLSHSVALPHWEAALSGFTELAKKFPHRADEFALELKEAQESRDKAYLYETMGIVPVPSVEKPTEYKPANPAAQKPPAPTKSAPEIIQPK